MISIVEPPKKTTAAHNKTGTTGEDLIVLTGIRWDTYEALSTDLGDRQIHLTYDRGRLEIMTLSSEHERYRKFLGRLIETMTLELRFAIASAGSTTIKRKDLQRGLESDDCYYVESEPKVRGKLHIDIAVDVPDLAPPERVYKIGHATSADGVLPQLNQPAVYLRGSPSSGIVALRLRDAARLCVGRQRRIRGKRAQSLFSVPARRGIGTLFETNHVGR